MKKILLVIFILSSLLFYGCRDAIQVYVTNNTQDNLEINRVGGHHVAQFESYHVMTIYRDVPQGSFKLCRGYGCLANVTVIAEFHGDTEPKVVETTITITEDPRDTFHATHGEYVSDVTITPLNY